MTTSTLNATPDSAQRKPLTSSFSRPAALIGGSIGLVALSVAATMLVVRAPASKDVADSQAGAPTALMSTNTTKSSGTVKEAPADLPDETASDRKPAPVQARSPATPSRTATPAARHAAAPSVCATCGVIEAVTPVKQKGEGSGVGAVGGAVVGGLLGSAVGKGDGRKVATVLGAVGGGYAGNEIEKNHKATTVYQVRVRMDDGTTRTVTQSSAPAVGAKVTLEGSVLRTRSS
jgi:outer membrane lipoprotein SlyB